MMWRCLMNQFIHITCIQKELKCHIGETPFENVVILRRRRLLSSMMKIMKKGQSTQRPCLIRFWSCTALHRLTAPYCGTFLNSPTYVPVNCLHPQTRLSAASYLSFHILPYTEQVNHHLH